jgi:hypothetical protein
MVPLLLQEGYCLNAIASHVHMERAVDFPEGLLQQPDVTGVIVDQKYLKGHVS